MRRTVILALAVAQAWGVEPKPDPVANLRSEVVDVQTAQDRLQKSQEKTRQLVESQARTLAEIQKGIQVIKAEADQTNRSLAGLQEGLIKLA